MLRQCTHAVMVVSGDMVSNDEGLSDQVKPPKCVRGLDWAANVWPDSRTKPKVEKYCLMSVQGSYTDFHIGM